MSCSQQKRLALGVFLAGFAAGIVLAPPAALADGQEASGSYSRLVLASWYGPRFDGRPTASGEIFDQHALTAAHKTLPFGTNLEVTNLANGRTVMVTINDRGPYVGRRQIDLSLGAAQHLGMVDQGVATVLLEQR